VALLDGMRCINKKADDTETEVTVEVPRRLLEGRDPADLLDAALADGEARGDIRMGRPVLTCTREQMKVIDACAPGAAAPIKDVDGCPSCLPASFDAAMCPKEEIRLCIAPPACDGVEPTRQGCCMSCTPTRPVCTEATEAACTASMAALSMWSARVPPIV
jgi:hypothetical protein